MLVLQWVPGKVLERFWSAGKISEQVRVLGAGSGKAEAGSGKSCGANSGAISSVAFLHTCGRLVLLGLFITSFHLRTKQCAGFRICFGHRSLARSSQQPFFEARISYARSLLSMPGSCLYGSACGERRCAACHYARNRDKIAMEFPWVELRSENPFSVGCSICRKAYCSVDSEGMSCGTKKAKDSLKWRRGGVTEYSSFQSRRLAKHESSLEHVKASGRNLPDVHPGAAPTSKQCLELLRHARKAPIGAEGLSTVGGQKKCRKLLWCLAEAHRDMNRALFRSGAAADGSRTFHSTSIYQDARRGHLALRFQTAHSGLQIGHGLFGVADLARDFSMDALGIVKGTMAIIRGFCTLCQHPPHLERTHEAVFDADLFARVVASIEVFCSDAAADEIRAGHMLAKQSTSSDYTPVLPSLKIVVRDKPHSVRRNLTRGWKADPFLHEVSQRFVFAEKSPTRIIQFSQVFKAWFAANIKQIDPDVVPVALKQDLRDLSFAPHRFESAAQPLTRICLFFHSFVATAKRVAWERKGKEEGQACDAFLRWLDVEKCVQLGMLADAAVENLQLTRLVDYQGFPLDELASYLAAFKRRLRALFAGPAPACKTLGCSGQMLRVLTRRLAIQLPGSATAANCVMLGHTDGVPADVVTRCMQRMSNWVAVVEETIDAEFPHFEVLQAFSCFNVKGEADLDRERLRACQRDLAKLRAAFRCPDNGLDNVDEQFQRLWYVARQVVTEDNRQSSAAWLEAARRVSRTKNKVDLADIMPLLAPWHGDPLCSHVSIRV